VHLQKALPSVKMTKGIAAVTGGSGMVGRKITQKLLQEGYEVRVLTRNKLFRDDSAQVYYGDIENTDILMLFLKDVSYLFHCAAELYDESKMWDVNVLGTEQLLRIVKKSNIQYLCYLSSAGVVGRTNVKWVNEEAICKPQNAYEQSKWAAEQLVAGGIDGCRIVILRPTNVIDNKRPGALGLPMRSSWLDRFKVLLKGGECAHIVHAEDVAEAAMYFVSRPFNTPRCFFVSCDYELMNTFAGLWALYRTIENNRPVDSVRPAPHLPLIVPHILRQLRHGKGNRGDVRYSTEKLISEGFKFHLGVEGAVKQIISTLGPKQL